MGRKKIKKLYTRKLGRIGTNDNHSYYVTIPMSFVKSLALKQGQTLKIKKVGTKLHLSK